MFKSFIIIYATQTGQAKSIAERISDLAVKNKFSVDLHFITDYEDDLTKFNTINKPCVFICSTTGDGEVPEMAVKCYNRLKKQHKTNQNFDLSKFKYALLGLGDTNYTQFCNGPKLFHKVFQSLGANCFYGPRWADDGTGLENEVEPFINDLWTALDKEIGHENLITDLGRLQLTTERDTPLSSIELTIPQLTDQQVQLEFEVESDGKEVDENEFLNKIFNNNLFEAVLTSKKVLTSDDAVKKCYQLKFKQSKVENNIKFKYEPGHSLDIPCPNDEKELKILFKCLNLTDSDVKRSLKLKLTDLKTKKSNLLTLCKLNETGFKYNLYNLFKYYFDIRSNTLKKALIRMLAESCSDDYDKRCLLELCSQEGTHLYTDAVKQSSLSLCDLLIKYSSCKPKIDYLIQFLQPLQPRSYTLASYNSTDDMEIAFNLVKFDSTQLRTYERDGIATGYLSKLELNENFYFLKRTLQNFVLPDDCFTKPIIMIGPGTGITPFISFLRYKLASKVDEDISKWYLYYGCRDPKKDFLYKNEILGDFKGLLKKFFVSFSRLNHDDDNECVEELTKNGYFKNEFKYVQDALKFSCSEICDLILNQNAYVYVCGDARNMSKDVFACLSDCLKNAKDFDSNKYLIEMMSSKRYRQDIWN
jgi:methionine synthase reductase